MKLFTRYVYIGRIRPAFIRQIVACPDRDAETETS